ncbi:class I SAM-dependent methyltransferase [Methylobacterium sp. C33D]
MARIDADGLDSFIKLVDSRYSGRLDHPEVVQTFYPLEFQYETHVDENLNPFSEEYFEAQLRLYKEISGRNLNQWDGELHPVHVDSLVHEANPLGVKNTNFVAEQVRALTTMLALCQLGETPKVLDMGAGHGLSSEVFAFCGCDVHSVDIDPQLSELATRRARGRGLAVRRTVANFDDLSSLSSSTYDAAFFFQSLHHCLRPWELISNLKEKMKIGGIIAFTGEPINYRWRNWGIRLDQESLYVARKYGWFESGWSHAFIRRCFAVNGFALTFFSGGHGNGEIAIASSDAAKVQRAEVMCSELGVVKRWPVEDDPQL